jgi:hypothetical protein
MTTEEIAAIIHPMIENEISPHDERMIARFLSLYFEHQNKSRVSEYGLDISDIDYRALIYALNNYRDNV